MNAVSIGEYHGLRVDSALLSIVAGCIIIGVSKDCKADAVGGIFLGAGGLGILISVYPFIRVWFNFHHILPNIGNFRVHLMATNSNPTTDWPAATLTQEGTQYQLNVERSKSQMGHFWRRSLQQLRAHRMMGGAFIHSLKIHYKAALMFNSNIRE